MFRTFVPSFSCATAIAATLCLIACERRGATAASELAEALTDSLRIIAEEADFNGFGVAIVDSTGVLYANGFGLADVASKTPYTANTRQPIASISKTFIGLAVMKAQELGRLHLDDPISKHLPFAVVSPHHLNKPITLRHLVTHTSSINDDREYLFRAWILRDTADLTRNLALDIGACRFSAPNTAVSMEEFLRRYLAKDGVWYSDSAFAATEPGSRFAYSNIGATLAALVVEKATGIPFDAFTQQYILDPLGMRSSTWHGELLPDTALSLLYRTRTEPFPRYFCATYPDGGMVTTSSDFARYMAELVQGYHGRGKVLNTASYAEYFREQLVDSNFVDRATGPFTDEHNIGITIGFSSKGYFGHTGGDPGLFSLFFVERKTGLGRYFIVNTDLEGYDHHIKVWELLGRYAQRMSTE
ncbi:MAG: beta-lactamase family protein [Flavobacteriales bacterium]|nr:beta-lactamase family protein [Flavobacteriales bacterium]